VTAISEASSTALNAAAESTSEAVAAAVNEVRSMCMVAACNLVFWQGNH
jgi:hypothetical protein